MGLEIERKFLLRSDHNDRHHNTWYAQVQRSMRMRQGYLLNDANRASSIRVRVAGDQAWLTIKSAIRGASRHEYEYSIPLSDAEQLLNTLCQKPLIEKTRYWLDYARHTWEIDVFEGDNTGLTVAEIELSTTDEVFQRPPWLGLEVTDDIRYYNASLVKQPYCQWRE